MITSPLQGKVAFWQSGSLELWEPAGPSALAGLHPLWADDLRDCGPAQSGVSASGQTWLLSRAGFMPPEAAPLMVFNRCGSVLDLAWELAGQGEISSFTSLLTLSQSAGRGQLRREWHSPAGNVYGAIFWPRPPREPAGRLDTLLPLILARLVVDYFEGLGLSMLYKWPNDLLWQDKKAGGMLIEERAQVLVAGIGINLAASPGLELLREEHACPAASLASSGLGLGPLRLWAGLVRSLQIGYSFALAKTKEDRLIAYLEERLAWLGREVEVSGSGFEPSRGRLLGLSPDGGLRLKAAFGAGELVLHSGGLRPIL